MTDEQRAILMTDPTFNVRELLDQAADRENERLEALNLRLCDQMESHRRYDDMQYKHLEDFARLRADHQMQIDDKESDRLDKIRQVDVQARDTAAERASDANGILANITATNAETLRAALANTATTIAKQRADDAIAVQTQMDNMVKLSNERFTSLERSRWEGEGRGSVTDPALVELVKEMKSVTGALAASKGGSEGMKSLWGYFAAAVGVIVGVVGIVLAIVK